MKYYGEFKNIDDELISISIVTNGSSADITNLMLAENPVTITTSSDGLFSPIKADGATIRILTNTIYPDMYSNTNMQSSVVISNVSKNIEIFRGFLTPNIYSQEYQGLDNLELEAVSSISALKNIKYTSKESIVKWYDIISFALRKVGYRSFYISNTYLSKVSDNINIIEKLYQFEGNFFDNDEEKTAWSYYDILEEFCKYFCFSLVVYNAEVYFIDYNNLKQYTKYNLVDNSSSKIAFSNLYKITSNSYKQTGATISYDETFNKISIKSNLYEFNNIVPNPFDKLKNQNADENKYYIQKTKIAENGEEVNYTYLNGFFNSEDWETNQSFEEITLENIDAHNDFSFFQKASSYKTEEEPSSLSWDSYLTVYSIGSIFLNRTDFLIAKPKISQDVICNGGYFIMNMDYFFSNNIYANDCFKTSDQKYSDAKEANPFDDTRFPCRLYIGEYYYDGEKWLHKDEYRRKLYKSYYKVCSITSMHNIPTWYKYKDSEGDWVFCHKDEWDRQSGVKESGKVKDSNCVYYFNGDKGTLEDRIYVDEPFYNECYLEDRFFLVHKNKLDDKIFDDTKRLTNTVSWRMNIVDSEDGVAIKLPSFLLSGKLQLEIYTPEILGNYGQYRTNGNPQKVTAIHISKLEMVYKVTDNKGNIYDGEANDDDVIYTNIINDNYVNEWDDLELKVNSQVDNRITSLSSVIFKETENSNYTFLNKIYDRTTNIEQLQEENIINRYYNHYKAPKLILQASLEDKITPLTRVHESNLNKDFIVDSSELDVRYKINNIKLIEY